MEDVKWIKITTDIFDDEKIKMIESLPSADSIIVIWFKLLCLAGKQNNGGIFFMNDRIPYTDEMLAAIFRREVSQVRLALQTFERFEMIAVVDGVFTIPNWAKHQTLDALEKKRERDREYQSRRREEQKKAIEEKLTKKSSDSRSTVGRDCSYSISNSNSYSFSNNKNIDNFEYILEGVSYKNAYKILENDDLYAALKDWMSYKDEKKPAAKNHYDSEMAMKKFLTVVLNAVEKYGKEQVIDVINKSIANGYQGIVWEWLTKQERKIDRLEAWANEEE